MKTRINTPVSRRPEAVTARILDAAQAEFMVFGYEAASTNRITAGFGGSKATLFRYYPTKEQLLEAVIRRIAERWRGAVSAEEIKPDSPEEWLLEFASRTLAWILQDEPLFVGRLAISEGHKFPALGQIFQETAGAPLQDVLTRRLADWTNAGSLACAEPARDAVHFLDLVVAGAVSRALYRQGTLTPRERPTHARRAVELFLKGRSAVLPRRRGHLTKGQIRR